MTFDSKTIDKCIKETQYFTLRRLFCFLIPLSYLPSLWMDHSCCCKKWIIQQLYDVTSHQALFKGLVFPTNTQADEKTLLAFITHLIHFGLTMGCDCGCSSSSFSPRNKTGEIATSFLSLHPTSTPLLPSIGLDVFAGPWTRHSKSDKKKYRNFNKVKRGIHF